MEQRTCIGIKPKDNYNEYMRRYMRRYRLLKKEQGCFYRVLEVEARPYKKRNIKVDVKSSEDCREYQKQYQRKYRKLDIAGNTSRPHVAAKVNAH